MKKFLIIGGSLLGLGLIVVLVVSFFLGSIVKAGINRYGPAFTQTKVELDGAHISPLSGKGTLTGLSVDNPKGWTEGRAFHLGTIRVDMEPFSVLSDHIVVNEVFIDQPEFFYETKIVSSNIGDLMKAIDASTGGGKQGPQPTTASGKPIKVVIKKFTLQNGKVTLGVAGVGGAAMTFPMPPVVLTDIGTAEGGITPGALSLAVMRGVTPSVIAASTQALGKLGGTTGAAGAAAVQQAGEAIKNLFGGKK